MGETAPLENARWMSHARQALQRKTRSVGRAARGEGEPQIPIKPPINPNVRVCPIQKADEFSTPRQHRSTHPEVVGGRNT